ncbi:hypothetical protein, partial [Microcystis sp. M_QC_C_20170808_M2Col]|uniref:hypothetical protein n=1 Tax=Microcystis sp. M_QC_C_20170808_M2Col TaxID=2486215 RepID=UPI00257C118D
PVCALSPSLYGFQLLLSVGALIEFYFKLIICITIPEEPDLVYCYFTEFCRFMKKMVLLPLSKSYPLVTSFLT